MPPNKFMITCKKCGSTECEIVTDIGEEPDYYDYSECE